MKKKLTACLTAACLAATAVGATVGMTGCSGGSKFPEKPSEKGDLSVMLLANSDEAKFYTEYFKKKEEEYGIKITFEYAGAGDYYNKLDAAIQGGTAPDIFYVRPNEILQYVDNIYCLDQFKDTVKTNEKLNLDLNDIYPLALNFYKYNDETGKLDENGELYAFPKDLSTQQLGYNKTLIEPSTQAIHDAQLKLPWELGENETYTWEEYHKVCEIIAKTGSTASPVYYGTDIPDIEILAKSFGGSILNTETMKVSVTSDPVKQAIDYQKSLVTPRNGNPAAADFANATQTNFQAGKVAFYGAVGSWEVNAYDTALGAGNWGLMPWPTTDGGANWYGKIMSAGYVVSNECTNWQDAMEIAASFMTRKVQDEMVRVKKVSIPMHKDIVSAYLNSDNDAQYSPATRSVFIDVISGTHGFRPTEYYTFQAGWQKPLSDELQKMWKGTISSVGDLAAIQNQMQGILEDY